MEGRSHFDYLAASFRAVPAFMDWLATNILPLIKIVEPINSKPVNSPLVSESRRPIGILHNSGAKQSLSLKINTLQRDRYE